MGSISPDKTQLPVAIIGGGLGGLVLANGLNRTGTSYKIYEATKRFSEIGAGISFLPNAIQALELINPDLFESIQHMIDYDENPDISQLRIHCGQTRLGRFTFGDQVIKLPKFNEYDKGRCGAHRARLLDELIKDIPADAAEFNKQMVDIEELPDSVKIIFKDGTTATAAAVICSDGIHSGARRIVLGKDDPATSPRYADAYAYRALVPREQADRLLAGTVGAGDGIMWIGEGRYVFQYPVEKGKLINVIAVVVQPGSSWSAPTFQADCTKEEMLADFAEFGEPLRALLGTTDFMKRWALFELPHVKAYAKGRVCLLGDAAHATTSHQGAGGSAAFEDAYVMAELLRDSQGKDLPNVFAAYNHVRCDRGNRVVTSSNEQGLLWTLQHPEIQHDLEKFKDNMTVRYRWLWGEDLPAEVQRARAWLREK